MQNKDISTAPMFFTVIDALYTRQRRWRRKEFLRWCFGVGARVAVSKGNQIGS